MIDRYAESDGESFREEIESLSANRIDPKFLYVTPRQSELWRQVFLKHSPVNENPEFTRIYREAFARVLDIFTPENLWLVGLGCGTGSKEAELQAVLKSAGRSTIFSAVDVSGDLVNESVSKLIEAGAEHRRSLICDLQSSFLKIWFDQPGGEIPRMVTFFGLVPNLAPSTVARIFRTALRTGDVLLASAHLAPVCGEGPEELSAAMKKVLPQYDNAETLAWIAEGLKELGLDQWVEAPEMTIGEMDGMPAFLALARWKSDEPFERWGHRFSPRVDQPLKSFYSIRYTPGLFEDFLRREGFEFKLLSMTTCRQEGIWAIRHAQKISVVLDSPAV